MLRSVASLGNSLMGTTSRKKKLAALRETRLDRLYQADDFSTEQAIYHKARTLKEDKKKKRKKSRKKKKRRSQRAKMEILQSMNPKKVQPFLGLDDIHLYKPETKVAATSTLPATAATVPAAVKAVPADVINQPPAAFGKFQDAVIELATAYAKDKEARTSKYETLLINAKTLYLEASTDTKTNATLLKVTRGTLDELERNMADKDKEFKKKWDDLDAESKTLFDAYNEKCENKSNKSYVTLLYSSLAEARVKADTVAYKQHMSKINDIVNKCTSPEEKRKKDLLQVGKTLEKLKGFKRFAPECDKDTYNDRLKPHIEHLERWKKAPNLLIDDAMLQSTVDAAEDEYDAVREECRKKEMPNTAHLKQVSPYWKYAKIAAATAAVGLAVGTVAFGFNDTVGAVRNVGSTVWDGGLTKLFTQGVNSAPSTVPGAVAGVATAPSTVPDVAAAPSTVPGVAAAPSTVPDVAAAPSTVPDVAGVAAAPSTVPDVAVPVTAAPPLQEAAPLVEKERPITSGLAEQRAKQASQLLESSLKAATEIKRKADEAEMQRLAAAKETQRVADMLAKTALEPQTEVTQKTVERLNNRRNNLAKEEEEAARKAQEAKAANDTVQADVERANQQKAQAERAVEATKEAEAAAAQAIAANKAAKKELEESQKKISQFEFVLRGLKVGQNKDPNNPVIAQQIEQFETLKSKAQLELDEKEVKKETAKANVEVTKEKVAEAEKGYFAKGTDYLKSFWKGGIRSKKKRYAQFRSRKRVQKQK